jgi:hypothetical protein
MLRANACNWGNVADCLILEERERAVAATGDRLNPEDYCPLRRSDLDAIAQDLNWSKEAATAFCDRYEQFWGRDCLRQVKRTVLGSHTIHSGGIFHEVQ